MAKRSIHGWAKLMIRRLVCLECRQFAGRSDPLARDRRCEATCPIMQHLPLLLAISRKVAAPTLGDYERKIQNTVCQRCTACPTAGDYCADRTTMHCPLSRSMPALIDTLERVQAVAAA